MPKKNYIAPVTMVDSFIIKNDMLTTSPLTYEWNKYATDEDEQLVRMRIYTMEQVEEETRFGNLW